ncbi:DEAD-box ATP-dependent RNA helicase 38 [Abeliophyllum distichum]|uniref:RNA helicase n=2 Tax=Abeliophyllum distichum TaxID=126358 RepID=A0ABD1NRP5_9LAMI
MEDNHPAHDDGASAVTTEAKPLQTKSWADVADEPDQEQTGTSDEISNVQLDSLSIDESKRVNNNLTDPDDSSIGLMCNDCKYIYTVKSGDTPYTSAKRFSDLNLSPELMECLDIEMKFERPSKIQAISLPKILNPPYKNVIAQAHNGSGKTTCFVLGMLSRVDRECKAPQALCICPTRELAIQNMEVLLKMGKYMEITSELAIPADSSNYIPIHKMPLITAQVIIGTPGTINKWIIAKILGMSQMKILVFDEADHMLSESGFQDVTVKIMKAIVKCNSNCQVLLFSATFEGAVLAFVSKTVEKLFVGDYERIVVKKEELSLDAVKQYRVQCPDEHSKIEAIKGKIFEIGDKVGQSIIFVRKRDSASNLHKALVKLGYEVTTIHGALKQEDRDTIIKEFKQGLTQVLISTDVLARGFDQRQVNLIVNFDLPVRYDKPWEPDYEVYLHRVGRAGRFGREGAVFNLLLDVDRDITIMDKIEKHFSVQIPQLGSWKSDKDFKDALKKAGLL